MINYETILSNYDDKLTLMQWLKKVEEALADASLSSVTISQPTETTAVLNFQFADGTSVSSPSLNLPRGLQGEQGEQGEQGAQGVGVSNVTINSNSHLIVTLTNGVEIDAGYINSQAAIVVDAALSSTSENPVQNKVIYTALQGKQDALTIDATPTSGSTNPVQSGGVYTALQNKLEEVVAANVDSESATSGQVLTADGSGGASWQTPQSSGGGTQLYLHTLQFNTDPYRIMSMYIITTTNTIINSVSSLCNTFRTPTAIAAKLLLNYDEWYIILSVGISNLNEIYYAGLTIQSLNFDSFDEITITDNVTAL